MSVITKRRARARKKSGDDYLQRRADLVVAAGKIFLEKGYRASCVNDIAQLVGIDRASLYYYVSGKEELFHEVIREATLDNVLVAESIHQNADRAPEKLRALIVALMKSFERHYPYLFVFIQEDMTQVSSDQSRWGKEMKALAKRFNDAVAGIVQSGLDQGSIGAERGSARLIAIGIIGMCNWSHRWFIPGTRDNAETIGNVFADMVLNGLIK